MAEEKKEPGLLNRRAVLLAGSSIVAANALLPAAQAQTTAASSSTGAVGSGGGKKPNIVVIYGDDIGITNLSCYSFGMMGYKTPNIDRIANEGLKFTDYYSEQSCTAGRSAFITGQSVFRTGLSKVGIPGSNIGLSTKDPTIAELLKPLGYSTGQFGKNHLGDKDEFLPTNHGFDEFYGNLYHLNAEEDPEQPDYPKDPAFRRRFGPRGVIHSFADGRIEDTGPLTRKRMETIDDDIAARSADFIDRQVKANKPFFMWVCFTHMHLRTHAKPSSAGQAGPDQSIYHDVMIDHDKNVGTVLDKIDALGIGNDTIVVYSTDNGPHANSWPDAATTPFRSEKDTNWEGAFRVPAVVRWPGKIKPGSVSIDIFHAMDWMPTFLAAAGESDIKDKLLAGYTIGDRSYKVHLDGYNQLPYLTGQAAQSARSEFFYFSDDGDLMCLRTGNWKFVFAEQRSPGTLEVWAEPLTMLRIPKIFNLRTDPFERADVDSNTYWDWYLDHAFFIMEAQDLTAKFIASFKDYPPRQKAASFSIDQILANMQSASSD
ncbi:MULTISPECIES: arylsulfatase [unclassified Acidisoma]|uniref:arylsulfatase n=1 Tax=unclassified Acidisoma TaxID=2634065 RepID=UPI00131CB46A|nr:MULTISPECIES: arylsulfatase [unclassified Acidisoma]